VTKDEKLYLEVIQMPEDGVRSKGYHLIVEHLSILANDCRVNLDDMMCGSEHAHHGGASATASVAIFMTNRTASPCV